MARPEEDRPRDRPRGRGREKLPDSADPTDIAMSVLARDKAPDYPARVLLAQQAALASEQRRLVPLDLRHRRLQLVAERIGIAFKLALILLALLLVGAVIFMIVDAARSEKVVVEAFDVPDALADAGATGEVVAAGVADELVRLQAATRTEARQRSVADTWSGDIKVQVPQTGISIGEIRRLLAAWLGDDTEVRGNVVRLGDDVLRLTVRGEDIPARSFSGSLRDLPAMSRRAAEHVYGSTEPALLLLHLNQTGRAAEALQLAPAAFNSASTAEERSRVAYLWAMGFTRVGRYEEARDRVRLAFTLDPWNWPAHTLFSATFRDDERMMAAVRWVRLRAAAAPEDRRPPDRTFVNEHLLRRNWSALVATYLADARETVEQGTTTFSLAPSLAEAEAFRHDHQAARRHLLNADPGDYVTAPLREFAAGFRELDLGRADRAIAPLERLRGAIRSSKELQHYFGDYQCYLALAHARVGQSREALRVLDAAPESSLCLAFRGEVLALAGKWTAATRAYRAAIRRFPSLPVPWERAGAALLARGDAERAAQLFRGSIERAPSWADPRFGLAEALMQLGRVEEAEAQYRQGARLAPRWGALHIGWGDALWRLGRREEALARFRAAAGMDLSTPDRLRLQQVLEEAGRT